MRSIKWKSNKVHWDYYFYVSIVQCKFWLYVKITFIFLWVRYHITWTAQRKIFSGSRSNGFSSILSIACNQGIPFCFIFGLYLPSIFFFPVVPQHLFSLHCFLCFYCMIALNSQLLFQFHQIFPPSLAPADRPCALCSWIPGGNACSWVLQETLFRLGVVKVGRVVDFSLEMADMEQTP